jgi:hypothetical protein
MFCYNYICCNSLFFFVETHVETIVVEESIDLYDAGVMHLSFFVISLYCLVKVVET